MRRRKQRVSIGQLSLLEHVSTSNPPQKRLACVVKTTPREAQAKTKQQHSEQRFPLRKERLDGLFRHYLQQHVALQRIMKYHREI